MATHEIATEIGKHITAEWTWKTSTQLLLRKPEPFAIN